MGQRVTIAVKHYSRQLDENMGVQSRDDLESCSEQPKQRVLSSSMSTKHLTSHYVTGWEHIPNPEPSSYLPYMANKMNTEINQIMRTAIWVHG